MPNGIQLPEGAQQPPHAGVRRTLADLNVSFADLARMSGVRYDRLIRTLNGYQDPTPDLMSQTAAALGMRPHELWQAESKAGSASARQD